MRTSAAGWNRSLIAAVLTLGSLACDPTMRPQDAGPMPAARGGKFLGNLVDATNANFTRYWNQVTPENSGKWGSVEPVRDRYNFGPLDQAYGFARANGFPFKLHTFVWGSQEPAFLAGLSNAERAEELEEFIRDTCARYPDVDLIDVVNEPLHAPSNARFGLGGDGATGFDWVIRSFQLARRYCPNAKLLLNEFGVINDRSFATRYRRIVELLRDRGLIDGVALQSHSFSLVGSRPRRSRATWTSSPPPACRSTSPSSTSTPPTIRCSCESTKRSSRSSGNTPQWSG